MQCVLVLQDFSAGCHGKVVSDCTVSSLRLPIYSRLSRVHRLILSFLGLSRDFSLIVDMLCIAMDTLVLF